MQGPSERITLYHKNTKETAQTEPLNNSTMAMIKELIGQLQYQFSTGGGFHHSAATTSHITWMVA
jgi:hypothetical protein